MTLIVSATNRLNSNTLILSKYYQKILNQKGVEAQILSLTDLPDNLIVTDLYKKRSDAFLPFQELIDKAGKIIFIIPEYNGSFPGILKVFIDACDYPNSFRNKKAALVGHSSGKYGNIRGIDHFTGICHYTGMEVMPLKIHITYISKELDENGDLTDPNTVKFSHEQIDKFIEF